MENFGWNFEGISFFVNFPRVIFEFHVSIYTVDEQERRIHETE